MAFTYGGDPAASDLAAIRFLIGDTDTDDQLLQDAEINWIRTNAGRSVYQAAHDCCYTIASKFSRLATSKSVGDLSLSYSDRAKAFFELAERLLELAARRDAPTPWVSPKNIVTSSDRTELGMDGQEFYTGLHDNKRL